VCPDTAVTPRVERARVVSGAVTPFQGTGLPVAGNAPFATPSVMAVVATDAVRTIQQQLVPSHPGDTARRPPA
jgi:hypothetical protein